MKLVTLLPLILIVGVMFMMTRSAKNKQRQAQDMRNQMEPGTGVRTIGGLYAVVKEVSSETVLLEITDGVHVHFAKNAIGAVLGEEEFNRIVHGIEPEEPEGLDEGGVEGGQTAADAEVEDGAEQPVTLDKSEPSDEAPERDGPAAKQDGPAAK